MFFFYFRFLFDFLFYDDPSCMLQTCWCSCNRPIVPKAHMFSTLALGMRSRPYRSYWANDRTVKQLVLMFVSAALLCWRGRADIHGTARPAAAMNPLHSSESGSLWVRIGVLCTSISVTDCLRNYSRLIFPRSLDGAYRRRRCRVLPSVAARCRSLSERHSGISGKHRTCGPNRPHNGVGDFVQTILLIISNSNGNNNSNNMVRDGSDHNIIPE